MTGLSREAHGNAIREYRQALFGRGGERDVGEPAVERRHRDEIGARRRRLVRAGRRARTRTAVEDAIVDGFCRRAVELGFHVHIADAGAALGLEHERLGARRDGDFIGELLTGFAGKGRWNAVFEHGQALFGRGRQRDVGEPAVERRHRDEIGARRRRLVRAGRRARARTAVEDAIVDGFCRRGIELGFHVHIADPGTARSLKHERLRAGRNRDFIGELLTGLAREGHGNAVFEHRQALFRGGREGDVGEAAVERRDRDEIGPRRRILIRAGRRARARTTVDDAIVRGRGRHCAEFRLHLDIADAGARRGLEYQRLGARRDRNGEHLSLAGRLSDLGLRNSVMQAGLGADFGGKRTGASRIHGDDLEEIQSAVG